MELALTYSVFIVVSSAEAVWYAKNARHYNQPRWQALAQAVVWGISVGGIAASGVYQVMK